MHTSTLKTAGRERRHLTALADDLAAADALRASWKRSGTGATLNVAADHKRADDGDETDDGTSSTLVHSAWLTDLAHTLRAACQRINANVSEAPDAPGVHTYVYVAEALAEVAGRVDVLALAKGEKLRAAVTLLDAYALEVASTGTEEVRA